MPAAFAGPASTNGHAVEPAVLGRAARRSAPRSSHAEWAPAGDRPDPVGILEAQWATRGLNAFSKLTRIVDYADQNERDHAALAAAAQDDRVTAGPALR